MPEVTSTTYGLGGFDPECPGCNVIEEKTITVEPSPIEQVRADIAGASTLAALKNVLTDAIDRGIIAT